MPSAMECLDFRLSQVAGRWESCEGGPAVRIFRNLSRKGGGIWIEVIYKNPQVSYSRPFKGLFGLWYFNFFGRVGMAYDSRRDILTLSLYGDYKRVGG